MSAMLFGDAMALRRGAAGREWVGLFSAEQLDEAIDLAARASHATVALFAAAPGAVPGRVVGAPDAAALEFVIEFFVPPESLDAFHSELELQLNRLSPRYKLQRNLGELERCVLRVVPAGTFHQHRIAARITPQMVRGDRWSASRALVDGVLVHANSGWHDTAL